MSNLCKLPGGLIPLNTQSRRCEELEKLQYACCPTLADENTDNCGVVRPQQATGNPHGRS
jgi:hypothetical protein